MWLLQGGPGGSGQTMLQFTAALPGAGVTMYLPDHRGTGLSSPLFCPAGSAPYQGACVRHLLSSVGAARLQAYSTTNAAMDLAYLMRCVALADAGPMVPYGASYGTYWLNRFLTLFGGNNATATGAGAGRPFVAGGVMDGVVHPLYLSFSQYAAGVDETARNFLSYCAQVRPRPRLLPLPSSIATLLAVVSQLTAPQDAFCAAMFAQAGSPIVVLRNILNDVRALRTAFMVSRRAIFFLFVCY
jgi:pimeloyl-ACP methyl ester carboxylesterase